MRERGQISKGRLNDPSYDNYEVIDVIGSGTFGKVYLVKDHNTQQQFAMKHVLQNKKYKNRQLEIMASIQSPFIVRLHHHFYMEDKDGVYLNLLMEYIPNTLSQLLKTNFSSKQFIPIPTAIAYTRCLLIGLRDIHLQNICHRDIKPSNILITQNQAKFCDFGSAKVLTAGQKNISYICSRYYRAPQLLLGANYYSSQVDIWSLGCVIAQIMTNHSLFDGSNSTSMLLKIVRALGCPSEQDMKAMYLEGSQFQITNVQAQGLQTKIRKFNPNASQQLLQLVKRMIVYNPQKRITAEDALKLQIFN